MLCVQSVLKRIDNDLLNMNVVFGNAWTVLQSTQDDAYTALDWLSLGLHWSFTASENTNNAASENCTV